MKRGFMLTFLWTLLESAQVSADMMGSGMMGQRMGYGLWGLNSIIGLLFTLGVLLLVWLLVIKLWNEIYRKRK